MLTHGHMLTRGTSADPWSHVDQEDKCYHMLTRGTSADPWSHVDQEDKC